MKVYIAGPYTNPDPVLNTTDAIMAGDLVALHGHFPFIPHLYMMWHMLSAHDYEFWMKHSSAWLDESDALIRLPGESAGSDREVEQARNMGIPVFYGVDAFLAHGANLECFKGIDFTSTVSFCCPHCGGDLCIDVDGS